MIGSYSYLFQDFTTSVENDIYDIEFPARQTPKEVRLGLCQRKTFDENCLNFVQLSKSMPSPLESEKSSNLVI